MDLNNLVKNVFDKREIGKDEAAAVLNYPDDQIITLVSSVYKVRKAFKGSEVKLHLLANLKSGSCEEDCSYCAQSAVSTASIDAFPLKKREEIIEGAKKAKASGADRYCTGLSSIRYDDTTIDALADAFRYIKQDVGVKTCCSLGFLTPQQATRLKEAGLDRINHNLNSSRSFYSQICSTHTYDERIENIRNCRAAGLEVCSGGIIGMGESQEDVIDMLFDLKSVTPDSIPINFLVPIEGTPLGKRTGELTPLYALKVLALTRLLHPECDIRVAGGREYNLRTLQPLALFLANSFFVSGYLTVGGDSLEKTVSMVEEAGFKVIIEE